MVLHGIDFPNEWISDFCRRHDVKRLALFGSILRDDFGPQSDIDFLVEFLPGKGPGLFGFAGMHLELEKLLGRDVHMHTISMLGPSYREQVARESVVQY